MLLSHTIFSRLQYFVLIELMMNYICKGALWVGSHNAHENVNWPHSFCIMILFLSQYFFFLSSFLPVFLFLSFHSFLLFSFFLSLTLSLLPLSFLWLQLPTPHSHDFIVMVCWEDSENRGVFYVICGEIWDHQ